MAASISRLGFGLSSIMGVSPRERERLLDTALDHGVTHFDVAPYYGSGDAEAILGGWASARRGAVTIATKAGLASSAGAPRLKALRTAARAVFRLAPGLKRAASGLAAPARAAHDPAAIRPSLESSLRQLRTDHVDILHLHDWPASAALRDDTLGELLRLRSEGKTLAIGFAGAAGEAEIVGDDGSDFDVLQFENSLVGPAPAQLMMAKDKLIVTHRALSSTLTAMTWLFRNRPGLRRRWEADLGLQLDDRQLPRVLLAWALHRNPAGAVLASTRRPDRLAEFAQVVQEPPLAPAGLDRFETLASRVRATLRHAAGVG